MRYEDASALVAGLHAEYVERVRRGESEGEAVTGVLDGVSNNADLLLLIWGAGRVRKAIDAVWEDIEEVVREG